MEVYIEGLRPLPPAPQVTGDQDCRTGRIGRTGKTGRTGRVVEGGGAMRDSTLEKGLFWLEYWLLEGEGAMKDSTLEKGLFWLEYWLLEGEGPPKSREHGPVRVKPSILGSSRQ